MDKLLWATSSSLGITLLAVLFLRHRVRSVPWFTAWIAFGILRDATLLLTYLSYGRHRAYFLVYWWASGLDLLLQVAVVFEVAKHVFYRSSGWAPQARRRFLILSSAAPLVGLFLALTMTPAARNRLDAWDARANLFMTAVIVLMCTAVMAVSRQLGLSWRTRVLQFTWGLTIWSSAAFVADTLHSYWRTIDDFGRLEDALVVVFQLVSLYWIAIFWKNEERRAVLPARATKDLTRIKDRLEYGQSNRP